MHIVKINTFFFILFIFINKFSSKIHKSNRRVPVNVNKDSSIAFMNFIESVQNLLFIRFSLVIIFSPHYGVMCKLLCQKAPK